MDKVVLREQLFNKYFQVENDVLVSDLIEKLSFIPEVWNKLRVLCEKNINHFKYYSSFEKFKMIKHNNKKYLILKLRMWRYVILDLDNMKNISNDEFNNVFDVEFFVRYFGEVKDEFGFELYQVQKYNGDIQELVDYYLDNENVFNLNSEIYCKFNIDDAWTWLFIDFVNSQIQLGFQTDDQLLYEQLFLNYDLTPYGMQDAINKMGIDKMKEIFSKVNGISIPGKCVPSDLYELYLNSNCLKK